MALTVGDTISELHRTLREYIEATYHIGWDGSGGCTNIWELAAESTNNPGTDFDQVKVTGGPDGIRTSGR